MSLRWLVLTLGGLLLSSALVGVAVRVVSLERAELEHESAWLSLSALAKRPDATRVSARLTSVRLHPGEQAIFELCAQDALADRAWLDAFDIVVWRPESQKLELKVPLDAAHLALVKRSSERACLPLGGGSVTSEGSYAVDVVWAGKPPPSGLVGRVPLRARVLAKSALGVRDGVLIACAALGALLCVLSAFAPGVVTLAKSRHTVLWALGGCAGSLAVAALVLRVPVPGSIGGLLRGVVIAVLEGAVALVCARYLFRSARAGLGLHAPAQWKVRWLMIAALTALVLRPVAHWAMRVVPETGQAPVEAFVSWPSGALAFAALGMIVPLAEELFFRGFVFGALSPLGVRTASVGALVLFASAHAQQLWGNWGALLSVTLTGAALTALRAWSGSTLISAIAHLLFNLSLWSDSFRA